MYINDGLFCRYLDTNSIGKIFIDGITDKYCSLKNLLFVIFILSVIILVIYINIDDFIDRKNTRKKITSIILLVISLMRKPYHITDKENHGVLFHIINELKLLVYYQW